VSVVCFKFIVREVKRELKRIHINGCRCNESINAKMEGSKRLGYTV
jgi:hypothetical protein